MQTGRGDDEADAVAPAPAGPAGHLLQLGGGERLPPLPAPHVYVLKHHRARGEVHAGRDGHRREDGVEQPRAHQLLDGELPGGQVPRVVRGHAAAQDHVPVAVLAHLRVLLGQLFEHAPAPLAPLRADAAPRRVSGLGRGLVAAAARGQKDDGGQQVVGAERREQYRGRHLGHPGAP